MNRRAANAYDDSDDSASDWDTTAAESPIRPNPFPPTFKHTQIQEEENIEADYATVIPRNELNLKKQEVNGKPTVPQTAPRTTPRKELSKRKQDLISPPPHLHSFKDALSDYSDVYEPAPDIPPKRFDEKGQVYTVPDSDQSAHQVAINWDDSDAEEKVLRELRQNREMERQKLDSKSELANDQTIQPSVGADNQGFESSPKPGHSNKTLQDLFWSKNNKDEASISQSQNDMGGKKTGKSSKSPQSRPKRTKPKKSSLLPVTVQDSQGKRCIFYFEDSAHHSLEVPGDDVQAFLPDKIDEAERLFRRVWREIFSAIRIVTSFFVFFVTELLSLVIHHILRPLVLDSLTSLGNHFLKPLMTIVFNMIIQPMFALLWNVLNGFYLALGPFIQILGAVCSKLAILLQSLKLFHVSYHHHHPPQAGWRPPEDV